MRFFARCNGSYFIVDTDALCRISCCRKNGICQRNIKRNCFSHAVVQVRSGTRDGLTVGQGCFSVFHPDSLSPEGIRSVRHSRCHHGIADENHALTSHHGEGRADNRTVNVIAVTDQLHAALRIVECGADDTRVTVCERRHGVVQMGDMVCSCFHGSQRGVIICCCMADGNHDFIGNLFDKFQ